MKAKHFDEKNNNFIKYVFRNEALKKKKNLFYKRKK